MSWVEAGVGALIPPFSAVQARAAPEHGAPKTRSAEGARLSHLRVAREGAVLVECAAKREDNP